MLLLTMKVYFLQKLRLNVLKTSSQTELKGPVDNLILVNELFNIYKEKETALFTINDNRAHQMNTLKI